MEGNKFYGELVGFPLKLSNCIECLNHRLMVGGASASSLKAKEEAHGTRSCLEIWRRLPQECCPSLIDCKRHGV